MQRPCTQNMCLFAVAFALASAAPTADRHRHHSTEPDIWLESPSATSPLSKRDVAALIDIDMALDAVKSKFREFIMEKSTSDTMATPVGPPSRDGPLLPSIPNPMYKASLPAANKEVATKVATIKKIQDYRREGLDRYQVEVRMPGMS